MLGGVHGTFLYPQVLSEAPWIDVVLRGEGEAVFLDLVRAVADGRWRTDRGSIRGIATRIDGRILATPAAPPIKDVDTIVADWSILDWSKYIYIPLKTRVAVANFARS